MLGTSRPADLDIANKEYKHERQTRRFALDFITSMSEQREVSDVEATLETRE